MGGVHEEALLVDLELVVGPEGVVEGEIAVLGALGIVGIVELGHVADHVHAQLAAQVRLPLVERTHPHSHFHTHITIKMSES